MTDDVRAHNSSIANNVSICPDIPEKRDISRNFNNDSLRRKSRIWIYYCHGIDETIAPSSND